MAFSADEKQWFVVNASPDIRAQFQSFPPLHPSKDSLRNSPLQAVLLTNSDLDHTAGLLFLREGEPLHLHASSVVRKHLSHPLAFTPVMDAYCGIVWHEPPVHRWAALPLRDGSPSGLSYQSIPLRSPPPLFDLDRGNREESTAAFLISDDKTGGVALIAPDIFEVNPSLKEAMQQAQVILFDGTFWSEEELGTVRSRARKSSAMGHLPIGQGSLKILSESPALHRVYLHINNTNPILMPESPERRAVEEVGLVVAWDGWEVTL